MKMYATCQFKLSLSFATLLADTSPRQTVSFDPDQFPGPILTKKLENDSLLAIEWF